MKNRIDINVTYKNRIILKFYVTPTTDGIIFGIKDKNLGDIHFILNYKDGKLRSHITDRTNIQQYPWGHQMTPDILAKKIEKRIKKWIRPYHGNKVTYIMTDYLKESIIKEMEKISSTDNIPMEFLRGIIITDFDNPKRWKKVKIRDLLEIKEIGLFYDGNIIRLTFPINNNQMICCSEIQFDNLLDMIFREIGLYDYFEYIQNKGFSPDM